MQAIARASMGERPFSDEVSDLLRESLGDWRAEIVVPDLSDIALRASFYAERGFDPDIARQTGGRPLEQSLGFRNFQTAGCADRDKGGGPSLPPVPERSPCFTVKSRIFTI